jgi:endo-1,4-beta-xylanase
MATLATGGSAQAALAPGTPLKTLAAAAGNRYFGSGMTQSLLSQTTATQLQAQQFSMVTPTSEMKWDATEPGNGQYNFTFGDAMVNYATANSERMRCNNLVGQSQLPAWLVQGVPVSQVQAAMEAHVTTVAKHFKGECYAWDVVNEPFNADGTLRLDVFSNAMGIGYIADALNTAHAADSTAKLYLNDFDIEGMNAKSNAMFSLAQQLLAAKVPLDGIGFESHFIVGGVPSDMQANMQRFANLGLDVAVTELDDRMTVPASTANLQQQATDFANAVKACLGVTRCVGVSTSAVGDADSTIPLIYVGQGAATMFDANYNPKPAFSAVQTALGGSSTTLTLTNPGPQHGTVGVPVTPVTLTASDPNIGATLAWTASALPAGLSLTVSGSSATISGTPTAAGIGTSNVTITVKDSTGAAASASFPWTITASSITITNPGPQHGTVGVPLSITLTVSDSNPAATITGSATGLPAGFSPTISSTSSTITISGTPTIAGTTTLTVTATDNAGASASVSFTLTIAPAQTSTCHVVYTRNSQWTGPPNGFTAQVTISNTGTTAITSWSLAFTFPGDQKITSNFNGGFSQTGENVTLTNASYNGNIAPGASVTDGFQGTWTSNDTSPTSFTVNGATCT